MKDISRREVLIFSGALSACIALLLLLGGAVLWTRPFWMDEAATFFLTTEPSFGSMLRLVARGGDWNPPLLHIVVWSVMRVTGTDAPTPAFLHTLSLVCVAAALILVYATLRRHLGTLASLAGVMALSAHALVVEHAFEGRFYGPWLLFAAGLVWSLGIDADAARSRRRDAAIAAFSILLVSIHWYGVLSLALLCLGAVAAAGHRYRDRLRVILPAGAGLIAFVAMSPLALSQRSSAAAVLWVPPLDWKQLPQLAGYLFPASLIVVLAMVLLASAFRRTDSLEQSKARIGAALRDAGIGAMLAASLMPLVLVAVSAFVTPSMISRYAIVATLAWAPLTAIAVEAMSGGRVGRALRMAAVAFIAVLLLQELRKARHQQTQYSLIIGRNAAAFEQARQLGIPVVFQRLHLMYAVAATQRSPTTPARYLDLSDSTIHALYPLDQWDALRATFRLERDQARYHARLFRWPIGISPAMLDTLPRFAIVATDVSLPSPYRPIQRYAAAMFPNHVARRISPELTLLERGTPVASRR